MENEDGFLAEIITVEHNGKFLAIHGMSSAIGETEEEAIANLRRVLEA